ncbi:molybdenum cofactor guanylyltransferase [Sphingomonas sp. RP10(2022)]|uniref:Molybdenum cofactor guanylyltransferase n=1 Tax=Sphingomonas liriopis TaxID=2949094 RepID=A0A9X2HX80_9SPHN|nr:molybdenum cofactor guanylyltransferase [Sphingomonas liriopis]
MLAGGRSSRFGTDKAAAPYRGRSLLDHARDLCELWTDATIVVGRPGGAPDLPGPHLGPLGGIAGALDHAVRHGFTSVLTIGCDMPNLPADLLKSLLRRSPSYCVDAPVVGHWPAALAPALLDHIATSTRRSVQGWARAIGALPIASPAPLANINTPADLMAL